MTFSRTQFSHPSNVKSEGCLSPKCSYKGCFVSAGRSIYEVAAPIYWTEFSKNKTLLIPSMNSYAVM